jgi:hypothetical protein
MYNKNLKREMKSFRISLRNVATSIACLAVALMSSGAMAQNVGDEFEIVYSSDLTIKYKVMSGNRVLIDGVWVSANAPYVLSFPETVEKWGIKYDITKYDADLSYGTGGADKISEIVFPNSIDSICDKVAWCDILRTVTFGTGVKYIGNQVFRSTHLTTINCNSVTPPTIHTNPDDHAFWDWDMAWVANCTVNVPCASLYQNSYWGNVFTNFNQTATCPSTLTVLSSDVSKGDAPSLCLPCHEAAMFSWAGTTAIWKTRT